MPANILVLDCDSSAGLECVQAFGRMGAVVEARASRQCAAFRSKYATVAALHPANCEELAEWISRRHQEQGYDLIVPATERSLLSFLTQSISSSALRRAVLGPAESLRTALDKEQTRQFAAALGVLTPQNRMVTAESEPPGAFPVVLKPVHSRRAHATGVEAYAVTIVRDSAEWLHAMRVTYATIPVQEQQYVAGTGIGVEMLFEHGEPRWHFVHRRLHEVPLTGGASSYRESLAPTPEFIEPAKRLLQGLRWHGVAMVEFKRTPTGEMYLMEINPRLWGSLALGIDAGINFPAGLLALSIGSPLPPQPKYRVSYRTRNVATDVYWMRANFLADHSDPLLLTRPRVASILEYLRPLAGTESWDFFDIHDLGVLRRVLAETASELSTTARMRLQSKTRGYLGSRLHYLFRQKAAARKLRRSPAPKLLFLCYGNICRSPLAGMLAQAQIPHATVSSAGFHAREGRVSPNFMHPIAARLGTSLTQHRSQRVTKAMVRDADAIFIMDRRNFADMRQEFPEALYKTMFLGAFAPSPHVELKDPYGLPSEQAAAIGDELGQCMHNLAGWLRSPKASRSR